MALVQRQLPHAQFQYRKTIRRSSGGKKAPEEDDTYMYGGMAFEHKPVWHVDRNRVTMEEIIKNGHFAWIYRSTLDKGTKNVFTKDDKLLMKAKMQK